MPGLPWSLASPSIAKPKFEPLRMYNYIKSQLSSHSFALRSQAAGFDCEFDTLPDFGDGLPQWVKSKMWKGLSGRKDMDQLRHSTYGGNMEDLEVFNEARMVERKLKMVKVATF